MSVPLLALSNYSTPCTGTIFCCAGQLSCPSGSPLFHMILAVKVRFLGRSCTILTLASLTTTMGYAKPCYSLGCLWASLTLTTFTATMRNTQLRWPHWRFYTAESHTTLPTPVSDAKIWTAPSSLWTPFKSASPAASVSNATANRPISSKLHATRSFTAGF